jgi:FkbM family methyltransferase
MNHIKKKIFILWLELTKLFFPSGLKLSIKHDIGRGLFFWFDKKTDNGFILGFYEEKLIQVLTTELKKGMSFYDLGAHWGYFSLIGSKLVGMAGNVYSFEPLPQNINRLNKNLKINDTIKNIKVLEYAVSSKKGKITFSNIDDSYANSYLVKNSDKALSLSVETTSLDEVIENENLTPPDFLKIDVEGAEHDVLIGAQRTIRKYRPLIHLSTHEIHNPGVDHLCTSFLKENNYSIQLLSTHIHGKISDYFARPSD